MRTLSSPCSSQLSVECDMNIGGSLPSLVLQLLCLWPQVFEREHNLALNSTFSVNVLVCTGQHWAKDDLLFRDVEQPALPWLSEDSKLKLWPQRLVPLDWGLPLTSSPESCGCEVVGHFSIPNLFP